MFKIKLKQLEFLSRIDVYQKVCLAGVLVFLLIVLPLIFTCNFKINSYFFEKEYLTKLVFKENKLREKVSVEKLENNARDLNLDIANIKKMAELSNLNVASIDLQESAKAEFLFSLQGNYLDLLNFLNSYNATDCIYQYKIIAVKKEASQVAIEITFSFNGELV